MTVTHSDETQRLRALGEQLRGESEGALSALQWHDVAASVSGEHWWPKSMALETGVEQMVEFLSEMIAIDASLTADLMPSSVDEDEAAVAEEFESAQDVPAKSTKRHLYPERVEPTSAGQRFPTKKSWIKSSASRQAVGKHSTRTSHRDSSPHRPAIRRDDRETGFPEQAETSLNTFEPGEKETSELLGFAPQTESSPKSDAERSAEPEAYRAASSSPVRSLGELAAALQYVQFDPQELSSAPAESRPEADQGSEPPPSVTRGSQRFADPLLSHEPSILSHGAVPDTDESGFDGWPGLEDEARPAQSAAPARTASPSHPLIAASESAAAPRQPASSAATVPEEPTAPSAWTPLGAGASQPEPELAVSHSKFGNAGEAKPSFTPEDYNEIFDALAKKLQREYRRFYGD